MSQNTLSSYPEWIIHFDTIESTNNYAIQLIKDGMAKHGQIIHANCQTMGKGQRGKKWQDSRENLKFTMLIQPTNLQQTPFALNFIISINIAKYLKIILPQHNKVNIKWPNDIYINDKKTCGILIENIYRGQNWHFSAVGIGLNVHQKEFPKSLNNAISLGIAAPNKHFDFIEIITDLRAGILNDLRKFNPEKMPLLLKEYNSLLYLNHQKIKFKNRKEETFFDALICGVNDKGHLVLKTEEGIFEFMNGSIEWIL